MNYSIWPFNMLFFSTGRFNDYLIKVVVYVNKHEDSKVNAINNIVLSAMEVKVKSSQIDSISVFVLSWYSYSFDLA